MSLSEQQIPEFLKNRPLWHFYVAGVVSLVLSGWLWWVGFYTAPSHVFQSMVSNSLSTRSFTTEADHSEGQNGLKQLIHTDVRTATARSILELEQDGTEIKKEVIGMPHTDYTRFLAINTSQKDDTGKAPDTSNIINVWSESDASAVQTDTTANGQQLYAMATLGVGLPLGSVPVAIGELPVRERQELLSRIWSDQVYRPDYKNVKKERKNGRLLYTYDVEIQAILYIRMMQNFGKLLGLTELDQVDPNTYSSTPALKVKLTIDAVSHRLAGVDNGQGATQTYSGYDIPLLVPVPKNTISAAELQRRLDEL